MFEGDVGKMKLNEPESQRIIRNAKKYHIKERLYDTHTSQKGEILRCPQLTEGRDFTMPTAHKRERFYDAHSSQKEEILRRP